MSGAQHHGRELARLRDKEAALRKELSRHQSEEAKALEGALKLMMSANKAASSSSRDSYARAADRERKKAVDANRKAAEITGKIAHNEKHQANKLSRLRSAERAGQLAADRAAGLDRVPRVPLASVAGHGARRPEDETLRVLYVTAHPDIDLIAEAEVRQVQQALRGARYRDRIEVQSRLTATVQELLDGLNEVRPQILHFSGQGGDQAGYPLLVRALTAADRPPELLLVNAPDSLDGVAAVLPIIRVIIGVPDAVSDTAAIVFSQQFYAALASGRSVAAALDRGRVTMQAVLLDDEAGEPPDFIAREDVDLESLVLMKAQPAAVTI